MGTATNATSTTPTGISAGGTGNSNAPGQGTNPAPAQTTGNQ
jgi:hypothetical protein